MFRPPFTLWLYLAADLWRLLLLTTAIAVTVTSFAFSIRFLADGQISPVLAVRVMFYMLVPMLQYTLPFSVCFAATLAYHRFAAENEAAAALAGGISHRRLLFPAAITGLVLAGVVLFLSDQVMPRLLRATQEVITKDIAQLMVGSIDRGEAIRLGEEGKDSKQIYADSVQLLGPDERSGAYMSMLLSGVLAVDLDKDGNVKAETSSRSAYVWLYRIAGPGAADTSDTDVITRVVLTPRDVVARSGTAFVEDSRQEHVIDFPGGIHDDPKFFTWSQLNDAAERPERINWIDRQRRVLATLLTERATRDAIAARLASTGSAAFTRSDDPASGRAPASGRSADRTVTLTSAGLGEYDKDRGWPVLPPAPGKPIEVTSTLAGGQKRVQRARSAWLSSESLDEAGRQSGSLALAGTLSIMLEQVSGLALGSDDPAGDSRSPAGVVARFPIRFLVPVDAPAADLADKPCDELLEIARSQRNPDKRIKAAADQIDHSATFMVREIRSKQNERIAYSVASVIMVLCGAILAMRMRTTIPLAVYLFSFIPALVCVLSISTGQRMMYQYGTPGLVLLWTGVAALFVLTVVQYLRLARH